MGGVNTWRRRGRRVAINKALIAKRSKPIGCAAEGHRARRQGLSPCDCPYILDTPDSRAWFIGWRMASEC